MMDYRGRRHERGSNWTDPEIVELLQLWSDESIQIELESSLRNQRVFDRIAHILRERGIYRTGDQCREKIKKMKLEYRRIKDNHKMRTWKFYDVMDRVLAGRPAVSYSSLGGAVIAQQMYQNAGMGDAFMQGYPAGSFGPASSGGFLFGQPPKGDNPMDIKCENMRRNLQNSSGPPPEMYYASGDEQETDGQSLLGPEDSMGQAESTGNTQVSPSDFSDLNITGSATPAGASAGPHQSEQRSKENPQSNRFRKRRRGCKASRVHGGSRQESLDKVLASFVTWQQSAQERLLSLEEARLEREFQAEEHREQREERRAEQQRQHELRLFSMLTGALRSAGQGSAYLLGEEATSSAAASESLSQPPADAVRARSSSAEKTETSPLTCVKTSQLTPNVSGSRTAVRAPGPSIYLSRRGNGIRKHQGILQEGFAQYGMNKYHDISNPDGILNLGTSENKLCFDLLHTRMTKPDMLHVEPSLLQYPDWTGHVFIRKAVAKFLTQNCSSPKPLKADNVVVMNGCGSLFSCIAAVICDPGDAILIPTPFYGVITEDLHLYSHVELFHVHLDCKVDDKDTRPFQLTVEKLEEGLQRAKKEGVVIRAIILMNPHNPLAEVYTLEQMITFLEFAKRNELHAIVDEVYMLTVFDESVAFRSVLSEDRLPDPQRTHVMWGMSKDFAMAGIRIGTLYTENRDIVEALAQLGSFHGIPGTSQHQVAQLLQDEEWISNQFLPENRRRLKAAHAYMTEELHSLDIPFLDSSAALYIWADLRKYLREPSFEEELALWRRFLKHKVVLSCGQAFSCSTPGWFRIVFAAERHHLQVGVERIREALKEAQEERNSSATPSINGPVEENSKTEESEGAETDNASIVNSISSPQNKSSEQLKEKDSPVPDTDLHASQEFVLLDCQESNSTESLGSLIGTLRHQIRSSDWLEKNTPELSAGEDPEIFDVFKALLQRAKK